MQADIEQQYELDEAAAPDDAQDDLAELGLGGSDNDNEEAEPAQDEPEEAVEPAEEEPEPAEDDLVVEGERQEDEEDDNASVQPDEAEEERPSKKKTDAQEQQAMREEVRALIGRMEQAVAKDADDLMVGKPGIRKLQMLHQIDDAVAKVKMHDILLQSGFIGLLKGFLEPLPTNRVSPSGQNVPTLPKSEVRATVYRALQRLPIDTLDVSSRHMLKSSGIGPVLKFYSQVKDEDAANRRLVNDLLNSWMAPIVEEGRKAVMDSTNEAQRREDDLAQLKRRRQQEREVENRDAKRLAASQEGKKVGDAGYRYHARVPRAAQPAYVNAPQVSEAARRAAGEKAAKEKGSRARIKKATLELQRQKKGGDVRSSKVELSTKRVGNDMM